MKTIASYSRTKTLLMALFVSIIAVGCDSSRDPILGAGSLASAPVTPPFNAPPTVDTLSLKPTANATGVCPTRSIAATFNVPSGLRMDDTTVNATTFTVTDSLLAPVTAASITLDTTTGTIATFTPDATLTDGMVYTATIIGGASGVKDTAVPANQMDADFSWTFTAGPPTGVCLPAVALGLATPFGIAATAGITNTTTMPISTINGDVVLDPTPNCNAVMIDAAGGFGLCGSNGSTPLINGMVVSPLYPDAGSTSGAIMADLKAAFLSISPPAGPPAAGSLGGATNLPAGTTLGDVTGSALVVGDNLFYPGVYQSLTSIGITGDIMLDAQGDPDAVFVFQSSSSLDIAAGSPLVHTNILLRNGAKASNIWWQVSTSATLGTYAKFVGNILASESITMETHAESCGRLLAGAFAAGAFVLDSNVVSVPGNGCPE